MTEEPTRNYFGTLMLLCVAFPFILSDVAWMLVQLYAFYRDEEAKADFFSIMYTVIGVLATVSVVVLLTTLFHKKWFDPEVKKSSIRYTPLLINGTIYFLGFILLLRTAAELAFTKVPKNFAPLGAVVVMGIKGMGIYIPVWGALQAELSTTEGLGYQPFRLAFKRGTQMSTVGCFMTVLTVIAPSVLTAYLIVTLPIWEPKSALTISLWIGAFVCSGLGSVMFFITGTKPYERTRPFKSGILLILAPLLLAGFCFLTESFSRRVFNLPYLMIQLDPYWLTWLDGVNNYAVYCTIYLVAGVLGYIAYVLPTDNSFARLYRVYYDEDDKETAKLAEP